MAITDSAPRTRLATELVDAALSLARVDFPSLLTIGGAATVISTAIGVVQIQALAGRHWVAYAVLYIVRIAVTGVFTGAGVVAASEAYFGRPVDAGHSLRVALGRAPALARVTLYKELAVGLGLVALIFPGLIALANFFAVSAAVAIEGCGARDAMSRSRTLAHGNERRILGALLPAGILFALLSWSALTVAAWLGATPVMQLLATGLGMVAFWPMYYALLVVLYYDARIRNEAFDITLMLQEMPAPVA